MRYFSLLNSTCSPITHPTAYIQLTSLHKKTGETHFIQGLTKCSKQKLSPTSAVPSLCQNCFWEIPARSHLRFPKVIELYFTQQHGLNIQLRNRFLPFSFLCPAAGTTAKTTKPESWAPEMFSSGTDCADWERHHAILANERRTSPQACSASLDPMG